MATEKVVSYSVEQTAEVVSSYQAGVSIEAIATAMGKSAKSVIAKLVREGVYKSPAKAKAESRVTKAQLVAKIAAAVGATEESLESLEKATKEALEIVAASL